MASFLPQIYLISLISAPLGCWYGKLPCYLDIAECPLLYFAHTFTLALYINDRSYTFILQYVAS